MLRSFRRSRCALLILGILCAAGGPAHAQLRGQAAAPPASPPPGPTQTVQAVPVGPQNIVFGPGNDQAACPDLPPFDQIPPVPMPPVFTDAGATGALLAHNAATGETFQIPQMLPFAQSGAVEGYVGVDGTDDRSEMARNFGTMTPAGGLNSFPRSPNCRLYMRFVNHSGGNVYYVASGTMLDGGVVLTAAHCVFDRDADVNNWAAEIWVYPGWDGLDAPSGTDTFQYWGYTRGTYFMAGSGYVNSGNTDYDMGVIGIARGTNRSVGMLTGWYGYAWGYDCATIQARTYNNFSYPAQGCGTPGVHDGRTMFYWSGGFDECPGNNLQLDTTPGCYTAVWGGMSGSSAYYISGTSRYAHAVCSTSDRAYIGRYCKMWDTFSTSLPPRGMPRRSP